MKRIAYILGFALLAFLFGFAPAAGFTACCGEWIVRQYVRGHDNGTDMLGIFQIAWAAFPITGGFFGNWMFSRTPTEQSMKRIAYIFWFAVVALLLSLALTSLFNMWYVPRYAHSHDGGLELIWISLIAWPSFLIAGGFFGNWLYRRNLTRRSTPVLVSLMRLNKYFVIAAILLFVSGGILFGISMYSTDIPMDERFRLAADLDGDSKPETVILSTAAPNPYREYSVRVGAATFRDEFFADGELPKIKFIRIDSSAKQKQLLVTTSGPAGCGYAILAFTQDRFFRLLKHSTKHCQEPRVVGDGLEIIVWESFWNRTERYTLNKQGTKLNPVSQTIYPVTSTNDATVTEIAGIAVEPLSLKSADCKDTTIPKGERVVVKSYDVSKKRYLLKGLGERCGWMPESDLHPYAVDGLPWAG